MLSFIANMIVFPFLKSSSFLLQELGNYCIFVDFYGLLHCFDFITTFRKDVTHLPHARFVLDAIALAPFAHLALHHIRFPFFANHPEVRLVLVVTAMNII